MELGKKLKQARLDAGLSQRQLCGDEITRNMLSQIENGSARPSMDTLRYLAARLEKPMSYFLEDAPSPAEARMAQARGALRAGEYADIPALLEDLPDSCFDEERQLLLTLAALALAEQAIREGRLPYARQLLQNAVRPSLYYTAELERRRLLLLAQAAPEEGQGIAELLPAVDGELMLRARAAFARGDHRRCIALLDAAEDQTDPGWCLLRGDACYAAGDAAGAKEYYHRAEDALPQQVYPRLERCYEQLEDYKMAYFYARKQRP